MTFAPRLALAVASALLALAPGCGASTTSSTDTGTSGIDAGSDGGITTTDTGVDAGAAPDTGGGDTDAGSDGGITGDTGTDGGTPIDTGADAGRRVPMYHRTSDAQCTTTPPAGNCSFGPGLACSTDSDCTAGTNGRCNMNLGGAAFCRCTYDTCAHDTDCATGSTCACHGAEFHADGNECIPGNCRTDADCGADGFCSPTIGGCGGLAGYYCHTPSDLCLDDGDCTGSTPQACEFVTTSSRWECVERFFCP